MAISVNGVNPQDEFSTWCIGSTKCQLCFQSFSSFNYCLLWKVFLVVCLFLFFYLTLLCLSFVSCELVFINKLHKSKSSSLFTKPPSQECSKQQDVMTEYPLHIHSVSDMVTGATDAGLELDGSCGPYFLELLSLLPHILAH